MLSPVLVGPILRLKCMDAQCISNTTRVCLKAMEKHFFLLLWPRFWVSRCWLALAVCRPQLKAWCPCPRLPCRVDHQFSRRSLKIKSSSSELPPYPSSGNFSSTQAACRHLEYQLRRFLLGVLGAIVGATSTSLGGNSPFCTRRLTLRCGVGCSPSTSGGG